VAIREAGSIGAWFESRIHSEFTEEADDQYGWGQLTREERIALSAAIGDALDAFVIRLQSDAPQLYQRDKWGDMPTLPAMAEPQPMSMDESAASEMPGISRPATAQREEPPMEGSTTGEQPATTVVVDTARITELETRLAEALRVQEEATARLAEAEARDRRSRNETAARATAARLLEASQVEARFRPATLPLIESAAVLHVAGVDGELDQAALDTAVSAAIDAERTRLGLLAEAFGCGQPAGVGAAPVGVTTSRIDDTETTSALIESYRARGMSADAAKLAATGRPF
jgi:hypothetical protein